MHIFKSLSVGSILIVLSACSSSDNGVVQVPDDNPANNVQETNSVVTLDASIRDSGADSSISISYTVTNTGSLELIIFDVGFLTSTGVGDDGLVTIFQSKRDTADADFESPPTIAGRNLSPDQTLAGSASRRLPISIDFEGPLVALNPDTVRFCIGYGTADDLIPTTLTDGTYSLNEELDLQLLTCALLERF